MPIELHLKQMNATRKVYLIKQVVNTFFKPEKKFVLSTDLKLLKDLLWSF